MTRPRLAATLATLGTEGGLSFYNGTIAANIVQDLGAAGGVITAEDLSSYRFFITKKHSKTQNDFLLLATCAPCILYPFLPLTFRH